MADNFIQAVKEMHAKMNSIQIPATPPPTQPANTIIDTITLLKRYPQILLPRTGK